MTTRKEIRKDRRLYNCVSIKCAKSEKCDVKSAPGLCVNTSTSGMCVYSTSPFSAGSNLEVECKFDGFMLRNATVRWCKKINKDLYKLGVEFQGKP